jgi:hypothetical protein
LRVDAGRIPDPHLSDLWFHREESGARLGEFKKVQGIAGAKGKGKGFKGQVAQGVKALSLERQRALVQKG